MTYEYIAYVSSGNVSSGNEVLRVTAEGEFIWNENADEMIASGDYSQYPSLRHVLKALRENERLRDAVAAECEKVARWIIHKGYATGHGDTIEDLLTELEWQVAEREREACCKIVHGQCESDNVAQRTVDAIRARGEE